ncbi:MAG TPA: tyrosine-type recombinase/integrase [Candidatus Limnocylindrales bacterium]|nr:tyrosine-type recombinase/integrase [Candidatus Limnocylindrales bacterium]
MSDLRQAAEEYLAIRRALGFKFALQGRLLLQFVSYMQDIGASALTTDVAVAWAKAPADADPAWWGQRLTVVRGFARHLHAIDGTCEVPPTDVLPAHFRRAVPYLYSEDEIAGLIGAAGALLPPLRGETYATLIALLAVSGMRIGEAIRLERQDIEWDQQLLVVRAAKHGKSRQVPLHPSAMAALSAYGSRRDQLCPRPGTPSFFLSARGVALAHRSVCATFRRIVTDAQIAPGRTPRPPRLHDLRHGFCVHTMLDWYRDGVDVEAVMPRLSTYVGHAKPSATYWYLEAAPELLALAAGRLEHAFGEPA